MFPFDFGFAPWTDGEGGGLLDVMVPTNEPARGGFQEKRRK